MLVPRPCFPLYEVIALSLAASVKHYDLLPEKSWECDLVSMDAQIDERTKAIFVNNPSSEFVWCCCMVHAVGCHS